MCCHYGRHIAWLPQGTSCFAKSRHLPCSDTPYIHYALLLWLVHGLATTKPLFSLMHCSGLELDMGQLHHHYWPGTARLLVRCYTLKSCRSIVGWEPDGVVWLSSPLKQQVVWHHLALGQSLSIHKASICLGATGQIWQNYWNSTSPITGPALWQALFINEFSIWPISGIQL